MNTPEDLRAMLRVARVQGAALVLRAVQAKAGAAPGAVVQVDQTTDIDKLAEDLVAVRWPMTPADRRANPWGKTC